EKLEDAGMHEVLTLQKAEANAQFAKFLENNYLDWIKKPESAPIMSHQLFAKKLFPSMEKEKPTFFFLIDNLRYDQWRVINTILTNYFRLDEEDHYYSILPTATQYARNAIFSGLMPLDMEKRYPDMWQNDEDEGGKNLHEGDFIADQIKRIMRKDCKFSYNKILTLEQGRDIADNLSNLMDNDLNVLVYNFVDMLSHARTDMAMIRELPNDEAAYRSRSLWWYGHSPLLDALMKRSQTNVTVVITADQGSMRAKPASKAIGDRHTNSQPRYKQGKNLNYSAKNVFHIKNPHDAKLP